MKAKGIRFVGKSFGRPAAGQKEKERSLHKEMTARNAIKGRFGQYKNAYGLAKIRDDCKLPSQRAIVSFDKCILYRLSRLDAL